MSDQTSHEAALVERGVNAQLAAWIDYWMEPEAIERTVAWYDRQGERVGPGVLVAELRKGGAPARAQTSLPERERAYAEGLRAWLEANCPDIAEHPAVFGVLGRLRYCHRDAPLEDAELAARVRAALTRLEQENPDGTGERQAT